MTKVKYLRKYRVVYIFNKCLVYDCALFNNGILEGNTIYTNNNNDDDDQPEEEISLST